MLGLLENEAGYDFLADQINSGSLLTLQKHAWPDMMSR